MSWNELCASHGFLKIVLLLTPAKLPSPLPPPQKNHPPPPPPPAWKEIVHACAPSTQDFPSLEGLFRHSPPPSPGISLDMPLRPPTLLEIPVLIGLVYIF